MSPQNAASKDKPPRKPMLHALAERSAGPPPVWLMRQAGRYLPEYRELRARAGGFLELCFTPTLASEATLQPVRRFGLDAAILFSDILVVPHGLGQRLWFSEGEGPLLEPIREETQLALLDLEGMAVRLAPVYEAVSRVAAALPREVALIGFAGAPWTVASYMIEGGSARDLVGARAWALSEPARFDRLLALLVEATVRHLSAQIEAGAEIVQIFDSWAGALGEAEFERWSIAPIRAIATRLRARHPGVKIIGFPRNAGVGYRRFVEHSGVDAVSLDPSVPLAWAAEALQPHCALQGNLDPALLQVGGKAMRAEARRIVEAWGKGPFVFNLGHGVTQTTPVEHVADLVATIRERRP